MTRALLDRVRTRLIESDADATPARVASALREEGLLLGDDAVLELVRTLRSELVGAGPLESVLRDPCVTDVLVNAPDEVWVDRGRGLERSDVAFNSTDEVRRLAQRLATAAGRRLHDAAPYVDARLPSGIRLHAVLPPIAVDGTLISLRIPARQTFTLDELVACRTVDAGTADALRALIRARLGFLVTGGTGSGKTTVLSTLLGEVAVTDRIVIVEDSTELSPRHPHVVQLQSRLPNVEGAGEVTSRDLVRQALRMRPDRLIVGEVRGPEVVDMLAAMNTGHEGGAGTVHANSPQDVPARLEALGLMAGLDRQAMHALIAAGIDAVVHLRRTSSGQRIVTGIHVLERSDGGLVHSVSAIESDGLQHRQGPGYARLRSRMDR
jgi:pilus assembly protein CpaF